MKWSWAIVGICCWTVTGLADTLILNSGDAVTGRITKDGANEFEIEVTTGVGAVKTRTVLKSSVKSVTFDTADYQMLDKYRPNPNQEFSAELCAEALAAQAAFLKTYPQSAYAGEIKQRSALLQAEKQHVVNGEVKFANRWMTPVEKERQVELWQRASRVAELKQSIAALERKLAETADSLARDQTRLGELDAMLAGMSDTVPLRGLNGRTTDNPNAQKQQVAQSRATCQRRIAERDAAHSQLGQQLEAARSSLAQSEEDYKQLAETPVQQTPPAQPAMTVRETNAPAVVEATNAPAPVTDAVAISEQKKESAPHVPAEPALPWPRRYQYWLLVAVSLVAFVTFRRG